MSDADDPAAAAAPAVQRAVRPAERIGVDAGAAVGAAMKRRRALASRRLRVLTGSIPAAIRAVHALEQPLGRRQPRLYPSGRTPNCRRAPRAAVSRARQVSIILDFLTFLAGATPAKQARMGGDDGQRQVSTRAARHDVPGEFRHLQSGGVEGLSMSSHRASLGTRVTAVGLRRAPHPVERRLLPRCRIHHGRGDTRRHRRRKFPTTSSIRWSRRSRSIRIRCSRRCWPPRPTRSRSSSCNSGWPNTPT